MLWGSTITLGYCRMLMAEATTDQKLGTPLRMHEAAFQQWGSVRSSTPYCLGVSSATPCVENRRWTLGGVTYATLNIQGSCNNLCDVDPHPVDRGSREVFSYEPQIVPVNRVAVPTP